MAGYQADLATLTRPSSPRVMPPNFASGITLPGTNQNHAVISGDWTEYVGAYFVAVDLGGASVPVVGASLTANGWTQLELVPPGGGVVAGLLPGQNFELSYFPGGQAGRQRPSDSTVIKYAPDHPAAVIQLGDDVAIGTPDHYTAQVFGLQGIGANGSHLRDFRCADIGCEAIENTSTPNLTAPAGTEAARTVAELIYNGGEIDFYRTNNGNGGTSRDKSISLNGATGDMTGWAAAATAAAQQNNSPALRSLATYWDGAHTQDRIGYRRVRPVDTAGGVQMQWGFEHRANPWLALIDGAVPGLAPVTDVTGNLGSTVNRWSQGIAGPTGWRVWANAGDANPAAELKSGGLAFGPGGAGAVDLTLSRSAAGVLDIASATAFVATATAGAATLPANPVGFVLVSLNGTQRKLPYYAV